MIREGTIYKIAILFSVLFYRPFILSVNYFKQHINIDLIFIYFFYL